MTKHAGATTVDGSFDGLAALVHSSAVTKDTPTNLTKALAAG